MRIITVPILMICLNTSASHMAYQIRNRQQPTVNGQLSTVNCQRSTVNGQLSTEICQLSTVNRPAFYKAMQENNKDLINSQLEELKSLPAEEKDAFMGAMLMKKAGVGGVPSAKLKLFREGRKMLESAIKKEPDNAEYRFLRLIVQEHAPGVLGYKDDTQKDIEYIRKSYKSLPGDVQQAIADYSKKSRLLKLDLS
jgi:hypothetical protein